MNGEAVIFISNHCIVVQKEENPSFVLIADNLGTWHHSAQILNNQRASVRGETVANMMITNKMQMKDPDRTVCTCTK